MNRRFIWDPETKQVVEITDQENRAEAAIPYANGLVSEAAAVHPSQISEYQNAGHLKHLGVEYKSDGSPVFRSRTQRADYLRARHLRDNDGGYRETKGTRT